MSLEANPMLSPMLSKQQLVLPRQSFQQLRAQIIAAGIPLLSAAEIEQEVTDRRGGYQEVALRSEPRNS
jgi:hypothetical protein